MDERLITLKLVLDELGISSEIGTIGDRKPVQKAIYLGQRFGVELGYRFGWYKMGPYSPELARDYFALAAAINNGEHLAEVTLRSQVRKHLARAKPLMVVPAALPLSQEDWLECLASLDYLQKISGLTAKNSLKAFEGTPKSRLLPYAEQAIETLAEAS